MDIAMQRIAAASAEGAALRTAFFAAQAETLARAARLSALALACGNKILLCGNGGSAADAQHIAAELANRFLIERPPLAAVALTTDTSVLTAIGNDYGYEQVFARQVLALGQKGDVLVCFSTSGNSPNVLAALAAAREKGLFTIGLTGKNGGAMREHCNLLLPVDHTHTPYIQEIHGAAGHLYCSLIDYYLFENVSHIQPDIEQGLWPPASTAESLTGTL